MPQIEAVAAFNSMPEGRRRVAALLDTEALAALLRMKEESVARATDGAMRADELSVRSRPRTGRGK